MLVLYDIVYNQVLNFEVPLKSAKDLYTFTKDILRYFLSILPVLCVFQGGCEIRNADIFPQVLRKLADHLLESG
jgi:hypothetical protein